MATKQVTICLSVVFIGTLIYNIWSLVSIVTWTYNLFKVGFLGYRS